MLTLLAPRYWGGHLLMVLALAAATGLGLWQLEAWQAAREAESRDLTGARPVPLSGVLGPDDVLTNADLGRPVRFAGSWLDADTMYVADRRQGSRTGYWVVTPVRIGNSAVPVVRGWSSGSSAPSVRGAVEVTGWLQASEGSQALDDDPRDDVIPEMRIASMVEHVEVDLYGAYVVSRSAGPGLEAVHPDAVPPVSGTTALRNLLYALQWWVFAAFAVYIWVRWCRDSLAPSSEEEVREERVRSGA